MSEKLFAEISSSQLGMGRIVIPSDMVRGDYIKRCSELGVVTVYVVSKGFVEVRVGKSIQNLIEYPDADDEYGSTLMFLRESNGRHHFAFEVFRDNNDVDESFEGVFVMKRSSGSRSVSVVGDVKSGSVSVVAEAGSDSKISLSAVDGEVSAKAKRINVDGDDVVITAYKSFEVIVPNDGDEAAVSISYKKGSGFEYKDEFDNKISIKDGQVDIITELINLGSGKEPVLLGDKTVSLIKDLIAAVSSITVATSIGAQPIINKAQVELLKKDLNSLKSKLTMTD